MSDNIYKFQKRAVDKPSQPIFNKDKIPNLNIPKVLIYVVGAFFAIQLLRQILPGQIDAYIVGGLAFNPLNYAHAQSIYADALIPHSLTLFASPVSYALFHDGWMHVLMNSLWLVVFGTPLAWRFGAVRFILFCLITAFGGVVLHFLSHFFENAPMIGASAITSGVMAATLRFAFTGPINYIPRSDISRYKLPAPELRDVIRTQIVIIFVVIWLVFNFISSVGTNVAWQAHVGGFLFGFIAFELLDPFKNSNNKRPKKPHFKTYH